MMRRKNSSIVVPSLIIATLLVVMSGACSEHQPGTYEGGGRGFGVPELTGGSTTEDSGVPDNYIPPDVFILPDVIIGG